MSFPRRPVGIALVLFAVLLAAVEAVALIDPVGSKLSDDGDPFGAPAPASQAVTGLAVSAALAALGFWLARGKRNPRARAM